MTANELIDKLESVSIRLLGKETEQAGRAIILYRESAIMLLQQAQKIEALKKELALQRLSDFSQEIEDRESAIYATGYWKGIEYKKMRELSDATIRELSVAFMLVLRRTPEDELFENVYEYSKLLLKKASSEK